MNSVEDLDVFKLAHQLADSEVVRKTLRKQAFILSGCSPSSFILHPFAFILSKPTITVILSRATNTAVVPTDHGSVSDTITAFIRTCRRQLCFPFPKLSRLADL
jgi:hypothetical protein